MIVTDRAAMSGLEPFSLSRNRNGRANRCVSRSETLSRHAGNMTQEELADRAGLSARYLGSIERAEVSATITVLGRLALALNVDPCDLIRTPVRRLKRR
jgi:DNA-binding XRE family transcriptional regulator